MTGFQAIIYPTHAPVKVRLSPLGFKPGFQNHAPVKGATSSGSGAVFFFALKKLQPAPVKGATALLISQYLRCVSLFLKSPILSIDYIKQLLFYLECNIDPRASTDNLTAMFAKISSVLQDHGFLCSTCSTLLSSLPQK